MLEKKFILIITLLLMVHPLIAQEPADRIEVLRNRLEALAASEVPGLSQRVDMTVGKTSIQSFLAGLGKSNGVNINVDPGLKIDVSLNFTQERVINVILFICRKYNLDIQFIGSILSVVTFKQVPTRQETKPINVTYNNFDTTLSFSFKRDSLGAVSKAITQASGINIVLAPGLESKLVNGYILNLPFEQALEKFAFSNSLSIENGSANTFLIHKLQPTEAQLKSNGKRSSTNRAITANIPGNLKYSVEEDINGDPLISLQSENTAIVTLIKSIATELKIDYIFFSEPDGTTSTSVERVNFSDFLRYILTGTDFTFKEEDGIFLIGNRRQEGLRNTLRVALQYRTIEDVLEAIPKDVGKDVQISRFDELNSLILSGSNPNIEEIGDFIRSIDQPVPVIMIELLIVEYKRTRDISTGITAGIGDAPVKSGGTVLPGVDFTLGSGTINDILNKVGLSNLGGVSPEFYIGLQAMESNGFLDITSTPRLATLNGHEASMNIGETDYYFEEQQSVIGTQNPQTLITGQWKSVTADFSIKIYPIVSGDEHITLDITVNQSDFTGRVSPDAPPGQTNRQFQSMIRVRNEDMIVLGGLERLEKNDSGKGLPLLSRIPVLKWFFSSRNKRRDRSKLMIFIKPIILQ